MITKPHWLAVGVFISDCLTSLTKTRGRWSLLVQSTRVEHNAGSDCYVE
jgi:hypothetical protein